MSKKGYLDFDTVTEIQTSFEDTSTVDVAFRDLDYFNTDLGEPQDHSKLYNRGKADQHPISAITGLQDALSNLDCGDCSTIEYERRGD